MNKKTVTSTGLLLWFFCTVIAAFILMCVVAVALGRKPGEGGMSGVGGTVLVVIPALAGFVTVWRVRGPSGVMELLKAMLPKLGAARIYVLIVLWYLAYAIVLRGSLRLAGVATPNFSASPMEILALEGQNWRELLAVAAAAIGWIGVLMPLVERLRSFARRAPSLIAGLCFSLLVAPGMLGSEDVSFLLYTISACAAMDMCWSVRRLLDGDLFSSFLILSLIGAGGVIGLYYFSTPAQIAESGLLVLSAISIRWIRGSSVPKHEVDTPPYLSTTQALQQV